MWAWMRINWWMLAQAALISTVLALSAIPDGAAAHGAAVGDGTVEGHQPSGPDVSHDQSLEQTGHCHPGLDCSIQAVFVATNVADPQQQDAPRRSKYLPSFLNWSPAFDPPPPRTLL
jgi:hypothetical protein